MNVLSIQSHVAYGHVGNSAAVFPLQRMGFTVWPVHTVQFSNHTGYPDWGGVPTPPETVADILSGLERRGALANCAAVLTGYIGSPELGDVIAETVSKVKAANPAAIYCCDPVMGDTGRGLYVRDGVPAFLQTRALPLADILTPNQFELKQLTGRDVVTADAVVATARDMLRGAGQSEVQRQSEETGQANETGQAKSVLVTSTELEDTPADAIDMMLVTAQAAWRTRTPRLSYDITPNGSGDAVAALFLGHFLKTGDQKEALIRATGAIFQLMQESQRLGGRELALIDAQNFYEEPSASFPLWEEG